MFAMKDLVGQRFGRLIVLEPTDERKNNRIIWKCRCDCGNIVFVNARRLVPGCDISCGCHKWDKQNPDLTGRRFGELVALEPTDERESGNVVWKCQCDCGNVAFTSARALKSGNVKSCGCLRNKH